MMQNAIFHVIIDIFFLTSDGREILTTKLPIKVSIKASF